MKHCKNIFSAILIATLVFSSFAPSIAEGEADREWEMAEAYGLSESVPPNEPVTFSGFMLLLDRALQLMDASKLPQWREMLPEARSSRKQMTRGEGFIALYYAAETLGGEFSSFNNDWSQLNDTIGPPWDYFQPDEAFFPDLFETVAVGEYWEGTRYVNAYFYAMGRKSQLSNQIIFSYDAQSNSMRPDEPLLYDDAVRAALRFYESRPQGLTPRVMTAADESILKQASAIRESIRTSVSNITVTGITYYVSNNGDDTNDGLTPETAWATLDKVNSGAISHKSMRKNPHFPEYLWASKKGNQSAKLQPGDAVLLERGGQWRGVLRAAEGVSYSAYGEGAKPVIIGSPENGAGAEKWSLLEGSENIWVFYRDLQDCGGILLDDATVAIKQAAYWDGKKYLYAGDQQIMEAEKKATLPPFDVQMLENLRFFNDIRYKKFKEAIDYGTFGALYLRCDEGNPGEIYQSIEFFTGNNSWNQGILGAANGATFDNLTLLYGCGVSAQSVENVTIQYCEVGWMGGQILGFSSVSLGLDDSLSILRSGDGITIGGKNTKALHNYVYQIFDNGITVEAFSADTKNIEEVARRKDCEISGNLLEYCAGGVIIADWYAWEKRVDAPVFVDITVDSNYILYTNMGGWAHLEDHALGHTYLSAIVLQLNPGNQNLLFSNNVLYLTHPISQLVNYGSYDGRAEALTFEGNTYVQHNLGKLIGWDIRGDEPAFYDYPYDLTAGQYILDVLGDETAIVLPLTMSGEPFGE